MDKKCNKYEAYFTFASEKEYQQHILDCPDCQNERIKEEKLSFLIKDSAETFKNIQKSNKMKKNVCKIACAMFLFVAIGTYAGFEIQQDHKYQQFTKINTETSIIAQDGLPTDEYGFFDYD